MNCLLLRALGLCLTLVLLSPATARAHEMQPAYLEITESQGHGVHVSFKRPANAGVTPGLLPHLSSGWLDRPGFVSADSETYRTMEWSINPAKLALNGQTVTIEGLERTVTDVLVRVTFADGESMTKVLRPLETSFTIAHGGKAALSGTDESLLGTASTYLRLGVEHILTGVDHLLFVLSLLLLVKGGRRVVATISSFTVAHSSTLALATLGWLRVAQPPVEACIALSIAFVAREVGRSPESRPGLAERQPWLVAFAFGLLHGLGFAGALRDVGLPQHAMVPALLFFNLGVEAGQLIFVVALFALLALGRLVQYRLGRPSRRSPLARFAASYAIGAIAMFWVVQRIALF